MRPFAYLQYVILPQLDALAVDGTARVLSGFSKIEDEAHEYAEKMFESYEVVSEDVDPADFADDALDQGMQYYELLADLRQGMVNLLAVGIYHLFEQHQTHLKRLIIAQGGTMPDVASLPTWAKVDELRLVANTVKHGDGGSARQLRTLRPDLFASDTLRGSSIQQHAVERPRENPLGGTDLFVKDDDLSRYRDAVRELWEGVRPLI